MVNKKTKLFVLDTNVLLHDPSCLYRFEEHDIYLPMVTLEELDNIKKGGLRSPEMHGRPVVSLKKLLLIQRLILIRGVS